MGGDPREVGHETENGRQLYKEICQGSLPYLCLLYLIVYKDSIMYNDPSHIINYIYIFLHTMLIDIYLYICTYISHIISKTLFLGCVLLLFSSNVLEKLQGEVKGHIQSHL